MSVMKPCDDNLFVSQNTGGGGGSGSGGSSSSTDSTGANVEQSKFEQRISRRLVDKIESMAELMYENLKAELTYHVEQTLVNMESKWCKNPYMKVFDEFRDQESDLSDVHERSYRALVQQIACDFRRSFFSEWNSELRAQRPFMNAVQRNMLQQMVGDRFHHHENTIALQMQELQRQSQILQAELNSLRYMVVRQRVECGEHGSPSARQHQCAQEIHVISPTTTPPPRALSPSLSPLSSPPLTASHE